MYSVFYAIEDDESGIEIGRVELGYKIMAIKRGVCHYCNEEIVCVKPYATSVLEVVDSLGNNVYPEFRIVEMIDEKNQVLIDPVPLPIPPDAKELEDLRIDTGVPLWPCLVGSALKQMDTDHDLIQVSCGCDEVLVPVIEQMSEKLYLFYSQSE